MVFRERRLKLNLPVRCLQIASVERSRSEMERIGVDPAGVRIMSPKQFHYNMKVEGLTAAQANVLKQDMLSIGGEAAVAKGAASCSVKATGAIISGTRADFERLIGKLKNQSFGLPQVASDLEEALQNSLTGVFEMEGRTKKWRLGERTLIMGVLNVTPDSFSDGGRFFDRERAVERALEMAEEGADWIDIGGESTRPKAGPVTADEELERVMPVIESVAAKVAVSIDTTKAVVAKAALKAGAEIVNDVSALGDKEMASVVAEYKAPVILMHMRGTPLTMQEDTSYGDLTSEVYDYLLSRIDIAVQSGVERDKIIIDPGIGFGKSAEGNFEILRNLSEFRSLGRPVLIGASRKSFIRKAAGAEAADRLSGTIAANVAAILNGASVIRVHDVKEARQAADIADSIKNFSE